MQFTSVLSGSRKFGGAPLLRSSLTSSLSIGLFRRAFQSSFPLRNISLESPASVLVAILRGKPRKFSVTPSQQLLKRERIYFRSARGWSKDCVNNWSHGREKKKKNIKLKIDLLNKIFPLICNTQIPNNLQILCLTSINCLFFLFSNSGNISKLFTFSKKQLQENEAIQLTIIILSLNNRKS